MLRYLVQCGAINHLVQIMEFSNPKTIRVALEGLENILKTGQDAVGHNGLTTNPYVQYVEECKGFEIVPSTFPKLCLSFFSKIARHSETMNNNIVDKGKL